ncbi:MAG: hypothetical protein WCH74_07045 [Chloroflexota bacterium]
MTGEMDRSIGGRLRGRVVAFALVMAAAAVGGGGVSSLAAYTSAGPVPANGFSSGSLTLGSSSGVAFSAAGLTPASPVASTLGVTNPGSLELRYAVAVGSVSGSTALASALLLTITAGTASGGTCTGTQLYAGPLVGGASGALIGTVAQGGGSGERTIAAGGSETLCFAVSAPATAPQGATAGVVLAFAAEQTKSNP